MVTYFSRPAPCFRPSETNCNPNPPFGNDFQKKITGKAPCKGAAIFYNFLLVENEGPELALCVCMGQFNTMMAALTLPLDPQIPALAEQEAMARHTTLPEVVAHQLRIMARNWQDSREGKTPLTDGLRGAVPLPRDFDPGATVTEELQKKQAVQG
jgi:hypothetical protein